LNRLLKRLAPLSNGTPRADLREALGLCVGLLALLTVAKPLLDGALGWSGAAFTLAAGWQLFIPLDRLDRRHIHPRVYGIHAHGLLGVPLRVLQARLAFHARRRKARWARRLTHVLAPYTRGARLDLRGAQRDLLAVLVFCAVTFPPFVVGFVLFQRFVAARAGHTAVLQWTVPPDALAFAATHLLLVATTEEVFYRGYIHTLLHRAWPPRLQKWGVGLGRAAITGAALFALGHFTGEWNPARLGPFFPALAFGALRGWSGSVLGAIVFHALCNILGEVMRVSVSWQ
jgi:membrane protease YdiL (CAAX protease family)